MISNNVIIQDNSVVAPNSVIPCNSLVGGVPATFIELLPEHTISEMEHDIQNKFTDIERDLHKYLNQKMAEKELQKKQPAEPPKVPETTES